MPKFKVGIKRFKDEVELPPGFFIIKFERHEFLDSEGEVKVEYEVIYLEPMKEEV